MTLSQVLVNTMTTPVDTANAKRICSPAKANFRLPAQTRNFPVVFRLDSAANSPRDGIRHVSSSGNRKIEATVLLVVGIVLWVLGAAGRPVAKNSDVGHHHPRLGSLSIAQAFHHVAAASRSSQLRARQTCTPPPADTMAPTT